MARTGAVSGSCVFKGLTSQREALKVAAENIPGVKAVKDYMVWVEPVSGMFIEPREEIITH